MRATGAILLFLMLAASIWMTGCSQPRNTAHEEAMPPYISPGISQEALNSLLRQKSQKAQPTPKAKLRAHKVRNRHESLFSISKWYTGSGSNWPRLVEANPDIEPRRIRVGDTVLIPEDLLITHRPMPAGFPKPGLKRPKARKARKRSIRPPARDEKTTLFGPIENDLQPAEPEETELPVPLETLD